MLGWQAGASRVVFGIRQFTRAIANFVIGASLLAVASLISSTVPDIVPAKVASAQSVDAKQSPAIEGPKTVEFPENSTAAVATYEVTNAASDSAISWSIDGTDARRLSIDNSGVLRFSVAKNFERPNDGNRDNEYEIELSAAVGSTHVSLEVMVRVTDVNEAPAFELESAEFSVEENVSPNRRVGGALVVIDPDDGDSRTFSVGGEDEDIFHIDAEGQIRVRPGAVLDYEVSGVLSLTVFVVDQGGLSDSLPVQIGLTDADDPGIVTFLSARPSVGVPYTATVSDQDGVTGRIRWRWHRAMNASDEFERIDGATRSSYTPVEDDEGYILRATVSYEDDFEVKASASEISAAVGRNAEPQFESASIILTVPEEAPVGTDVGDPVSATDSDDDDLTYALSGEDSSYFEVNDSSGQITVGAQALPDSETKAGYTVIVTATDEAGATASITVTITARVSNAPPEISGSTIVIYAENGTASVATYTATDPDDDGITWGVGGTDAARFQMSAAGELMFNTPPDYEDPGDANKDNVYEVTVWASDGNLSTELDIEVTVININEAASIEGSASITYPESGTTSVATYTATDPDDDGITWSIEGPDAARFSISEMGELSFNSSPDYEKARDANKDNVYEVTVTASDGNLTVELDVKVTVTDVAETISITGPTTVRYVENGTAAVSTYAATDPNGAGVTWDTTGADAARFAISEMGELSFNSSPDYEKARDANKDNVYEVTVTASDGNLTVELDVEVTVTDVAETISITGPATVRYVENGTAAVSTYTATDPEDDGITWGIEGTDAARFSISETGELSFNSSPDYEKARDANKDNMYEVTVTASDGNLTSELDIEVTVTDVDEAIGITGPATVSYTENGTASVATYAAIDLDGDGITWGIEGIDAARFSISETGELSFNSSPDYEEPRDVNKDNVYEVTVTASDGNLTVELDVEVTVTDVAETISIIGPATVRYVENGTAAVSTYTATDPEDDGITWGIEGTDAARFAISEMGELSFNSSPDYEELRDVNKDNVYEVTVKASDGDLSTELDVAVTVTDVNEAAIITGHATASYTENSTTTVAVYSATDPEADGITWGIEGTDAARFQMSTAGELSFNSPPDYEDPSDGNKDNIHEVTVTASDGNLTAKLDVEITVTNINEAMLIEGSTTINYPENGTASVSTYTATNPNGAGVTWDATGKDSARFQMSVAGELKFNSPPDYENPSDGNKDNLYEVTVTASDGNLTVELDVEITVTNINEAAIITGPATASYTENNITTVAVYSAKDPDGDGITWGIEGTDAPRFSISETGELSFNSPPDYENPNDANKDNLYEVTVTASDGNLTIKLDVEVTVTNVNEAASITGPVSVTYIENGTDAVAKYTLVDPDGRDDNPIGWEIVGTDMAHFVIDNQGKLAFMESPNFENPLDADADNAYLLRIVVDDDGNESGLDVVVEVTDANDRPRFPSRAIVTEIPENSCPGAYTLYRGIGVDPDTRADEDGDSLTYALSGPDAQTFVIHPPTGYVTLGPGTLLDFETSRKPFQLRVSVSDGRDDLGDAEREFKADDHLDLTVIIKDVDEPPVFNEAQLIVDSCGNPVGHEPGQLRRTVMAGVRGGSHVEAALSVIDPEGKSVHFRIVSQSDQGAFIVDSKSGQIMAAPDFSPRDARRVYTLRVAAMDGELESQIEVRIAVMKAPKPAPDRDVEDSSTRNPESANDAEESTPVQSDETSSDSPPLDGNTAESASTRNTLNRPPVHFKHVEPVFVPVPRAVQTPLFGRSEVQDQTGHARLIAPAGTLAVPYQVRLTQDEAACVPLNGAAPLLRCMCVSVEFFDVAGEPLAQESLNRPVLLEIVLRRQHETEGSEGENGHVEIGHDSVKMMMRQDDEREWGYVHASLREPADGSSILMAQVRLPGQYVALVTESRAETENPASAEPRHFPKPAIAQQAQNTVSNNTRKRTVSFVYDSFAALPQSQPAPVVSTEPQAWQISRLLIALLLDVTVALSAGIVLQRITFRRH